MPDPAPVEVSCPHIICAEVFEIAEDRLGRGVRCPNCGKEMTARSVKIWEVLKKRQDAYLAQDHAWQAEQENRPFKMGSARTRDWFYHRPKPGDKHFDSFRYDLQYEAGTDRPQRRIEPIRELVVVLDDLRSQWNVGAVFRTIDCAGWGAIHLAGITPMPPARGVMRVSLGAESYVPWDYHARVLDSLMKLCDAGYTPVALEQTDDAEELFDFEPPQRMALIVGNEVAGVSREVLGQTARRLQIPMVGRKASLNAAVAFGIAAFEIRQRWFRRWGEG